MYAADSHARSVELCQPATMSGGHTNETEEDSQAR